MHDDFYDFLGVDGDAGAADVKRAYRDRARELHPDVNDSPRAEDEFVALQTAHEVLSDPTERADYDRMGHRAYAETRLDLPEGLFDPGSGPSAGDDGNESAAPDSTADARQSTGTGEGTATDRRGNATRSRTRPAGSRSTTDASASDGGATGATATRTDASTGTDSKYARRRERRRARKRMRRRNFLAVQVAVVAGLLAYLAGLARYALRREAAVRALSTAPTATLARTDILVDPVPFLRASFAPTPDALFAVGMVLLPAAVAVGAARSVDRTPWVAAAAALGPLAGVGLLAAAPGVVPFGAAAVLLFVAPVGAVLGWAGYLRRAH